MELASSSVRTPSQYVIEGAACVRSSDCGAAHGVVASSSASLYGVFLSGRRKIQDAAHGKAAVARVVVRDQVLCGVSGSLYRSSEHQGPRGRRFCDGLFRGCRLGQVPGQESGTQLGDVAGPSGRTLRTDISSSCHDVSMSSHIASYEGLVRGNKRYSKNISKRSVRSIGLCTGFLQLGHATASAAGYRSENKPVGSSSGYGGWILKPAAGLINLPLTSKLVASSYTITSSLNGNLRQEKAGRDVKAAATPSDYRMTYPDVTSDTVASNSYLVQEGDTLTSIAKKFQTSVPVLAQVNGIADVDLLLAGQPLLVPKAYERVPGPGVDIDEFPVPTGYELRAPHERITHNQLGYKSVSSNRAYTTARVPVQESRSQVLAASVMPAVGPNFAKFAVPVLLIAPLLGFCIRCIVDALYIHMDQEEARRQSEREAYSEAHKPKAQRWQRILEEDRESDEDEGPNLMKDWPKDNVWSSELTGPTENIWKSEGTGVMDPDAREKTREILNMDKEEKVVVRDEKDEYEDIRKSYAELESSYMKFLVDSGLSKSGYWRGGVPTTTAHNGEPQ